MRVCFVLARKKAKIYCIFTVILLVIYTVLKLPQRLLSHDTNVLTFDIRVGVTTAAGALSL